ncbi:nuclear transport factor 2 family protein [Rhodovulum iodosum]|nr:nuclear transport factor 2 family protein [Rhodovulum robiginosum]
MMDDVETIVRKFHESWDLRDPERGMSVIAEDCHFEDVARGELLPGPEAYKRDYERWLTAFPDGALEITNVIVQGDWAVVEFTNRGTQTGPLRSSLGTFPPSGRRMEARYCSVMRVKDGKVVEGRDYYDSASIARQLGLVD